MVIEKKYSPLLNQTLKTVLNEESFQSFLSNGVDSHCVI